jgi:formylglycine-generating enzyme required for sulfatase activity
MSQSLRGTHTPVYASPEQRKHAEPDPRDDVHALAVIGYQLLLGDPTEEPSADLEDTLKHVKINEALIQIIKDALRTRREQRLEHAGVLADRLKSLAVGTLVNQEIKPAPVEEPEQIVRAPRKPKELVEALKAELPKTCTFDLRNGVNLEMVLIPAGTFMMGSPDSEAERSSNETLHQVTISNPFYLGKYPITQAQWQQVMGTKPSHFESDKLLPVENVSWNDTKAFCIKLREITHAPFGIPTEAQWEYACRAGTMTPYHFGSQLNGREANCDGTVPYGTVKEGPYLEKTSAVGKYPANPWGLYDMHGNVWEWCSDWYGDYPPESVKDPSGPADGSIRVLRGGSWRNVAVFCRSANRSWNGPSNRFLNLGFRLALSSIWNPQVKVGLENV